MNPKRSIKLAGLCAVGLLAVTACGSGSDGSSATPTTPGAGSAGTATSGSTDTSGADVGKIGISIPLLTTDFWRNFNDAASAEVDARGLDALEIVNAGGDAAKQLSDIDALVSQGAKGIILSPVDSGAITAKLEELAKKDIKVVVVNDGVSAPVAIVVRANNLDYGRLACDAMSKVVTEGSIIHIAGDPTNVAAQERASGFDDCMAEKAPDVKMVRIDAKGWAASEAADALPALLDANPDVKGIYMHAGGAFLEPTLAALKAKGLLVPAGEDGHIYLASIDGIQPEFDAIKAGFADFVIAQPVNLYGKYGVDYLEQVLQGTPIVEGPTDHDTTIIRDDAGNLQDALQPILVTVDNVDEFSK